MSKNKTIKSYANLDESLEVCGMKLFCNELFIIKIGGSAYLSRITCSFIVVYNRSEFKINWNLCICIVF